MSDEEKRSAGIAAANLVKGGMRIGLGTGSTARFAIQRLGERIRDEGLRIAGLPTSLASAALARDCGIPLLDFADTDRLDLTIDGADEIDPAFHMIKGGGGALLREKVIASCSDEVVIVVDPAKLVPRLGRSFRLPIEVVPFARHPVARAAALCGAEPRLRLGPDAAPYLTDNGNWILDLAFADGIAAPAELEATLDRIPGVVETGLFVGLCDRLVIGRPGAHEIRASLKPAR